MAEATGEVDPLRCPRGEGASWGRMAAHCLRRVKAPRFAVPPAPLWSPGRTLMLRATATSPSAASPLRPSPRLAVVNSAVAEVGGLARLPPLDDSRTHALLTARPAHGARPAVQAVRVVASAAGVPTFALHRPAGAEEAEEGLGAAGA